MIRSDKNAKWAIKFLKKIATKSTVHPANVCHYNFFIKIYCALRFAQNTCDIKMLSMTKNTIFFYLILQRCYSAYLFICHNSAVNISAWFKVLSWESIQWHLFLYVCTHHISEMVVSQLNLEPPLLQAILGEEVRVRWKSVVGWFEIKLLLSKC